MRARTALAVFCLASLAACASGPKRGGPPGGFGGGGGQDVASQTDQILADARRIKAEKGCAAAIPSYRVVASFGKGHDTAQFELGDCLLEQAGVETTPEAALFAEEGAFWLRRAAFAGNARAQLALAEALSGAAQRNAGGLSPDPVEAYGWSLVYADNPAHNLYGLPNVHPTIANHFKASLTPAMTQAAEAFAKRFRIIEMGVFNPPQRAGNGERGRPGGMGRPGGGPGGGGPGGGPGGRGLT